MFPKIQSNGPPRPTKKRRPRISTSAIFNFFGVIDPFKKNKNVVGRNFGELESFVVKKYLSI
jgi:hypothetical protein